MSRARFVMIAGALALGACGDGGTDVPADCDRSVSPGADDRTSVQEMFEAAVDGDTLCLLPGTYHFDDGVTLARKSGITLRGTGATREDVVLDFFEMGTGSSGINASSMTDFRLEHMRILDASANNVFITDSTDVVIDDVSSGWVQRPTNMRGRYALYPVQSTNVEIVRSEAFGSSDAGIYVGQTTNCLVHDSVAFGNVAGIEIENSIGCEVRDNEAYGNTGGILVFELPGLEIHGHTTLVHHNDIHENNLENFATDGIVAVLPTGIGIMLLAPNEVEVRDNEITGNDSVAIVVVSYITPIALGEAMPTDPDYEMYPDAVWIHDNTFTGNGLAPWAPLTLITGQQTPPGTTLEDIISDGQFNADAMNDLCIDEGGTFRSADISDMFATQSTDRAPVTCEGVAVPPVTL